MSDADFVIDYDMELNEILIKLGDLRKARDKVINEHLFKSDVKEWLVDNLTKEIETIERDIAIIVTGHINEV